MSEIRRICVSGLGYIGLPTASLLATKGFEVHGVDVDPNVIDSISAGRIHIQEPELDILVKSALQSGRLSVSTEPTAADVFILAVPTPFSDGFVPDLSFVEASARALGPHVVAGNLVVLESTSPVGTTESVAEWVGQERPDLPAAGAADERVFFAHCPERVLPGRILRELVENDRIVGGLDSDSTEYAASFYRKFVSGTVLETDSRTAEMAKLVENTYRDVNIAFANEISLICEDTGVDVWSLIRLANHHPRVNILQPGPGVGGHCIAVDPWFIIHGAKERARLIRTAREVNSQKTTHIIQQIQASARELNVPTIACLGLAYKPDVDDLRESPAVEIAKTLAKSKIGSVLAVEPHIQALPDHLAEAGVSLVDLEVALSDADIVAALVDHREFKQISPALLEGKTVYDARGIWASQGNAASGGVPE